MIHGLYSLKYLNIFTKATSMCASVQIIQERLVDFDSKYNVANLGELKFYLSAKVSEDLLVKESSVEIFFFIPNVPTKTILGKLSLSVSLS